MNAEYAELCKGLSSHRRSMILDSVTAALAENTADAVAYAVNGHALALAGRLQDSAAAYATSLSIDTDQPEVLSDYIQVILGLGDTNKAAAAARSAIERFPDSVECQFTAAGVFERLGESTSAEQALRRTLELKPASGPANSKLARLLTDRGEYAQALSYARMAVKQMNGDAALHNTLGHILHCLGRPDAAIDSFEKAAQFQPDWHIAWHNLGRACSDAGDAERAVEMYRKAICCEPGNAASHGNLATELLKLGRWKQGWASFEWRFGQSGKIPQRDGYYAPVWQGQQLSGESVMVWVEQGLGDNLQFLRFTRAVKERGGKLWLQAPPQCAALYRHCSWIDRLIIAPEVAEGFDFQVPLMSLPHVLNIDSEHELMMDGPILNAPALSRRMQALLAQYNTAQYRVGLVWASSRHHDMHLIRDCPLDLLLPLNQISGVQLFSFQYGQGSAEIAGNNRHGVVDLSSEIDGFANTAALISEMDLIITVDTAMAHLAGCLGVSTWVLLGEPCDWRWQYGREDSPWYPSVRLFRQQVPGSWQPVIDRVSHMLSAEVSRSLG